MKKIKPIAAAILASFNASAAIEISKYPASLISGVKPNVTLSVDDSGSMMATFLPQSIKELKSTNRFKSSDFNTIFYNPSIEYKVPPFVPRTSTFESAPSDGYSKTNCGNIDLSKKFTGHIEYCNVKKKYGPIGPAHYYQYNGTGDRNSDSSYKKVLIGPDEEENFAIWFSYYRKREYLQKATVAMSFKDLTNGMRINYKTINDQKINDLKPLTEDEKTKMIAWLYNVKSVKGTPLMHSLDLTGKYYKEDAPYRDDPSDTDSPMRSCRANYAITISDGKWYYYSGAPTYYGDIDGTSGSVSIPSNSLGISEAYSPSSDYTRIYSDNNSNYLADMAFKYWSEDLKPDLDNNVPTRLGDISTDINGDGEINNEDLFWNPKNNPSSWQHLVNINISLGVNGSLNPETDYGKLLDGSIQWNNDEADDFWHAAINSRGQYFNAYNTNELASALKEGLTEITSPRGSSTSTAVNSKRINTKSLVYQGSFNIKDRSGELSAYSISDGSAEGPICNKKPDGQTCATPEWLASETISNQDWDTGRSIITMQDDKGIPFRWSSLSAVSKKLIQSESILEYIRGNNEMEGDKPSDYRVRENKLGEIVNSTPVFVGPPSSRFLDSSYSDPNTGFKKRYEDRKPMVYVGANDGLLHALDANTGQEIMAFTPKASIENLHTIASKDGNDLAFLDGNLAYSDAKVDGKWETVIAGTIGLGGNSVFALKVTDPSTFSEHNADDIVMWEFTDEDMGVIQVKPLITKINDGRWVVAFNNGYNSKQEKAFLYVIDLNTGDLIRKVPTGFSPLGNGLSGITGVDIHSDADTDLILAGDLKGNLWQYDISSRNESNWKAQLKFKATDIDGNERPIVQPPTTQKHPTGTGRIVYFGTGKYLDKSDMLDRQVHSIYGVWLKPGSLHPTREHLLEQTFVPGVNENQFSGVTAMTLTNNHMRWHDQPGLPTNKKTHMGWYVDLNQNKGERINGEPFLREGKIIFTTIVPSNDPCNNSGDGYLYEFNSLTGGRLDYTPFDYDQDGTFSKDDKLTIGGKKLPGAAIKIDGAGILNVSKNSIVIRPDENEIKFISTSVGGIKSINERAKNYNSKSWIELK